MMAILLVGGKFGLRTVEVYRRQVLKTMTEISALAGAIFDDGGDSSCLRQGETRQTIVDINLIKMGAQVKVVQG